METKHLITAEGSRVGDIKDCPLKELLKWLLRAMATIVEYSRGSVPSINDPLLL